MNRTVLMMQPAAFREAADAYDALRVSGRAMPPRQPRVLNLPGRIAERAAPFLAGRGVDDSFRADGVGVVQVTGPIWYSASPFAAVMGWGSATSIIYALDRHLADPEVRAGVLDIQSPGGEAHPMTELAEAVRRFTASKPLYARLSGNVFSLGYALACPATEISIGPGGRVGSIGSIVSMLDDSEHLAREGLRFVTAASSAKKLRHAPGYPLGDEVLADLQSQVDRYGAEFFSLVSECRGVPVEKVRGWDGAEFFADEAKAVGLVDVIETEHAFWERVQAAVAAGPTPPGAGGATNRAGRVAPKTAGVAARTTKGARMSGTQNRGGVPKAQTARELHEKMKSSGQFEDDEIERVGALIEEDEEAGAETENDDKDNGQAENSVRRGERPASFAQLDRVVPKSIADRDGLIARMQREGACVNTAMGMVQDALLKEVNALRGDTANNSAARRETAPFSKGREPVPGTNRGGGGGGGETAAAEWERRVGETMSTARVPRHEAVARLSRADPALRQRYIAETNSKERGPVK